MEEVLADLRPWFTAGNDVPRALSRAKWWGAHNPDYGSRNVLHLREPFFAHYPKLTRYIPVLLQVMYMRTVYGIDSREAFADIFPLEEVQTTALQLLADDTALAMLSSQAINFLYTWAQLNNAYEQKLDPTNFLAVGKRQYDRQDKLHLQLLIYLYTHCIIGATHFYYRNIPKEQLPVYQEMILDLEKVIAGNYQDINLDNKFEFLVCARILQYQTGLLDRINAEAAVSVSTEGTFLIDQKNNNPQAKNTSFEKSEHRNILFLLSQSPYRPIG